MRQRDETELDVIVVGGGLFGAMLTHRLTVRGARVLLLEADDVGARAARRRLMIDAALASGVPSIERAVASRSVLAILEAQAPHLVRSSSILASTDGPWAMRRAIAALAVQDRLAGGRHASAEPAPITELTLRSPIRLSVHTLDEARLALAYALAASVRGGIVETGARVVAVRADPSGRLVVTSSSAASGSGRRDTEDVARAVVLTTGGDLDGLPSEVPAEPLTHGLEFIVARQLSPYAFVDRQRERTLEHLPYFDRSLVRITAGQPPDLDAALDHLFSLVPRTPVEVFDQHRAARHSGSVKVARGPWPGLFTLTGDDLATGHAEVQRLASELAGGGLRIGDDARIEEGDFEVTPAIERTRLGAEILHVLGVRHGERASAIVERVMGAPREGTLVCPCSTVTEAELRYAHREEFARDLSALSRRTELGVGSCAGVRCAHRAATILAEETLSSRIDPARRGGLTAHSAEIFLASRARVASFEPSRAAALRELSRSMSAAAGLGDDAPSGEKSP